MSGHKSGDLQNRSREGKQACRLRLAKLDNRKSSHKYPLKVFRWELYRGMSNMCTIPGIYETASTSSHAQVNGQHLSPRQTTPSIRTTSSNSSKPRVMLMRRCYKSDAGLRPTSQRTLRRKRRSHHRMVKHLRSRALRSSGRDRPAVRTVWPEGRLPPAVWRAGPP